MLVPMASDGCRIEDTSMKDTRRELATWSPAWLAKSVAALIGLAIVFGGCAKRWEPDLDPNIMACKSYGFYEGSPEFDQCMKYVAGRRDRRAP